MTAKETSRLATGLCREYGKRRGTAVAWDMYRVSAMTRGELYRVLRYIKNM